MRFEPGVGGWEPGRRLLYRMSLDDTEVEVLFSATWPNILGWFRDWCPVV
jgi:hypothetical protein